MSLHIVTKTVVAGVQYLIERGRSAVTHLGVVISDPAAGRALPRVGAVRAGADAAGLDRAGALGPGLALGGIEAGLESRSITWCSNRRVWSSAEPAPLTAARSCFSCPGVIDMCVAITSALSAPVPAAPDLPPLSRPESRRNWLALIPSFAASCSRSFAPTASPPRQIRPSLMQTDDRASHGPMLGSPDGTVSIRPARGCETRRMQVDEGDGR